MILKKIFFTLLIGFLSISCFEKQEDKLKQKSALENLKEQKGTISNDTLQWTNKLDEAALIKEFNLTGKTQISTNLDDYLIGKTQFDKDSGFVLVSPAHSTKTIYLRTQVYAAFLKMFEAAQNDGINLTILSGARSFEHQKSIWERKWNTLKDLVPIKRAENILKFSSMPMSSRHHWGTDIDLNSLENSYFESGEGLKVYQWLTKNAAQYGFCQVYSDKSKDGRTGYEMEKWHWSYMPLASQVLERYNQKITLEDIQGFLGSETAKEINIIDNYVNGIANCK